MNTPIPASTSQTSNRKGSIALNTWFWAFIIACLAAANSTAATLTLFTNNFDTYTGVATNLTDIASANPPVSTAVNSIKVVNDRASATPVAVGSFGANGIQVINWDSASAPNSILVRPGATFNCNVYPRGGTNHTFEWKMKTMKSGTSDRGFRISLRVQGADINDDGTDFVVFRSKQLTTANAGNSGTDGMDAFEAYNGIQGTPGASSWVTVTNTTTTLREYITSGAWNDYKLVADSVGRTFAFYVNGNLVNGGLYCARPVEMIVSGIRFEHESSSNNKDYYLVDDISLKVEGTFTDLSTTITEGFESYPAAVLPTDDADPQGAWVVGETAGTGASVALTPAKVQVVNTEAHLGSKSLKLEGGQIAGATLPWGEMPNRDVRIKWWQKVPATPGGNAMYLRVSVYGFEARLSTAADCLLLGSGSRSSAPFGGPTSLMGFNRLAAPGNGTWLDTLEQFTADTWEEYELTTNLKLSTYTIVRNPSGTPVVIVEDYPFIAAVPMHNPYMIGFSSSNGSGHPPVYIDDITIQSFDNAAPPPLRVYTPTITGSRFTNYTVLTVPGQLVSGVAVDPRDSSSIIFTTSEAEIGTIRRAQKVAGGNWQLDSTPIVTGLDQPKGVTVETNGTIWWVHDDIQSLRRLKAPWSSNPVEEIISDFISVNNLRDQPIGLTFFVTNGTTVLAVLDRNSDNVTSRNAIYLVDPATTTLNAIGYTSYLVPPSTTVLGDGLVGPANAIATLPATGEVVTTLQNDGWISAIDGSGAVRYIGTSSTTAGTNLYFARGIAVDPTTSRIWVAGSDYPTPSLTVTNQVWSFDSTNGAETQELTFPRVNPSAARPDQRITFAEGGMAFAPDGSFLVISDQSYLSGGGRLVIFHNEPFTVPAVSITNVTRSGANVELTWSTGGGVNYEVQRSANVNGPYNGISGLLTTTQYTDTSAPAGQAFYRVAVYAQQ